MMRRRVLGASASGPPPITASGKEAPLALDTCAPFHLEATVRVLQRRPTNLVDVWREERYLRALSIEDRPFLIAVENRGSIDVPDLRCSMRAGQPSSSDRQRLTAMLRRMLGLDVDPAPLHERAIAEPALRPTAWALRGMRPPRFASLFETFASVVPFQQISLEAGLAIMGRLVERFGEHLDLGGERFRLFPTARSFAEARIDGMTRCGLSRRKAESLHAIAREIASGRLTETNIAAMSTSDALRLLTDLPGIGPWSAGVVLLRGFGRLDEFPPGDVGVARGLGTLLGVSSVADLNAMVERFGELRGYLYFCSLGGNLLAKGLIHPALEPRP